MAYCSNCGKKAEENARFCSNCGKPILPAANPRQSQPPAPVQGQENSGLLWSFLAGTGIGVFLSNLFGHSASSSASSSPSTTNQYHDTVIYDHHNSGNDNNFHERAYENDGEWSDNNSDSFDGYDDYNDNTDYNSYDDSYDDGFDNDYDDY